MRLVPGHSWAPRRMKGKGGKRSHSRGGSKTRPCGMLQRLKRKVCWEPTVLSGGGDIGPEPTADGGGAEEGGGMEGGGVADPGSLGLEGGGALAVTIHALTTWMKGSPFDPVTDVNVRVHVSVTGPASLQLCQRVPRGRTCHARLSSLHGLRGKWQRGRVSVFLTIEVGLGGGPGGCRCCGRQTEKDQDGNKDKGHRIKSVMHVRVSMLNTD